MRPRHLPLLALLAAAGLPDYEEPLPDRALEGDRSGIDAPTPEGNAAGDVQTVAPVQPLGDVETLGPADTVRATSALPPAVSAGPQLPAPPAGPGESTLPPTPAPVEPAPSAAPDDLRQQLEGLQQQVEELQAQQPALQDRAAQLDDLVQRGDDLQAARAARARALDVTSSDLEEILYALQAGASDFVGDLGAIEERLAETAQNASDAGAAQESRAIEGARVRVEAAGLALEQSDLFNARLDLSSALPFVRQAAVLAATSEQQQLFAP